MPPSGGIVVFAVWFSTICVDAFRISLWTSLDEGFVDRDLLRAAQILLTRSGVTARFSTARVDVSRISLWTSRAHGFANSDLLRDGENLPTRSAAGRAVFHSLCGCFSNKPVDKPSSWLCRQ
jgi:hypothetical protein